MVQFSSSYLRRWFPLGSAALLLVASTLSVLGFSHYRKSGPSMRELFTSDVTATSDTLEVPGISMLTVVSEAIALVPEVSPTKITLKAVGDMAIGTRYSKVPQAEKMTMFAGVDGQLGWSDLLFGNLETTLTHYPNAAKDISQPNIYAFRTDPNYGDLLRDAGFNALSIANNHTFDYGEKGYGDTKENLKRVGITPVGIKNEIHYRQHKDLTLAFIGFSTYQYHNSIHDLETAIALVKKAEAEADLTIISIHAGAEGTHANRVRPGTEWFFGENRGDLLHFSRTLINSGADLILGHGPHVLRAIELYENRLIAYSLGNFVGDGAFSVAGILAESVILEATLDSSGQFLEGRLHPVRLNKKGFPFYDESGASIKSIRQLTQQDFPDTPLTIHENGHILPR